MLEREGIFLVDHMKIDTTKLFNIKLYSFELS